jgi:hypothetical protein
LFHTTAHRASARHFWAEQITDSGGCLPALSGGVANGMASYPSIARGIGCAARVFVTDRHLKDACGGSRRTAPPTRFYVPGQRHSKRAHGDLFDR